MILAPTFKIVEIINIAALIFLLLGGYGLPLTGFLQVIAALFFLILYPNNKLIYIYFAFVLFFFALWDGKSFDWLFCIPIGLIFFLTFIIYQKKNQLKKNETQLFSETKQ